MYLAKRFLAAWLALAAAALPAAAQFADQATFAGTGAGSANAQTATIPNMAAYADVLGVLIKYVPAATNTATATFNPNTIGAQTIVKMSTAGLTALTGGELVAGQPAALMWNGSFWVLMTPTADVIQARNVGPTALGYDSPVNFGLVASVSGNALAICAGTGFAGTPTPSSPIALGFRSAGQSSGNIDYDTISTATCLTIASGSTMGCQSAVPCRLWVVGMNNAGAVALCLFNAVNSSGPSIATIDEGIPQVSQSGTSGGNSAQLYYCNIGSLSSKAVRILGYLEATETTAGTWATAPSSLQVFGPGVKRPGDIVKVSFVAGATLAFAAESGTNLVIASASESITLGNGVSSAVTLKRGATTIATQAVNNGTVNGLEYAASLGPVLDWPQTAGSVTYTINNSAGTPANQIMMLQEIQG